MSHRSRQSSLSSSMNGSTSSSSKKLSMVINRCSNVAKSRTDIRILVTWCYFIIVTDKGIISSLHSKHRRNCGKDWLWKIIGLQKMGWCKISRLKTKMGTLENALEKTKISRFKTNMGTLENSLEKTTFCNTLPMILIGYGNHRMAWRVRKNPANFPISTPWVLL
jgi:hypothetical protein